MGYGLKWLEYAKKLQAIAQSGIEYSKDKYDIERFEAIRNISIDIMSNYTDIDHTKVKELFASETGYQTPKIDIRAAAFKDNLILLVKEKLDEKWSLPGGWADIDYSLKENVIRECMEEAGARVEPKRLIAILDRKKNYVIPAPYSIYKIFIECDCLNCCFEKNIETSRANFFSMDNLPPLSPTRITEEQIEMCFKARKEKCYQAIFD